MFGFSFSELVVVVLVALVVMGPKDLPKMLRRLGQYAGKIRRAAADLRAQSGIDDALRSEGLADDIAEIRKLARGELDAVQRAATIDAGVAPAALLSRESSHASYARGDDFHVVRDREYPRDGADAYGALPDDAIVYSDGLPRSIHARDPLYMLGDADAVLPPDPHLPPDHGGEEMPPEASVPVHGPYLPEGPHRPPEPTLLGVAPPADQPNMDTASGAPDGEAPRMESP